MKKDRGFTLTELLVVMAIIGLLTSVVLGSLQGARASARNAQRISVAQSYKLGFDLAFDTYNQFPDSAGTFKCLGQYTGNVCWLEGSYANSSTIDGIINGFVPGRPTPDPTNIPWYGTLYYSNSPNTYQLHWFLEGTYKNCSFGVSQNPASWAAYNITYCVFTR